MGGLPRRVEYPAGIPLVTAIDKMQGSFELLGRSPDCARQSRTSTWTPLSGSGSIATEIGCPRNLRFSPESC